MGCCTIKPMPLAWAWLETLFNKDKLDEFETDDLGDCDNFEISHLSKFQVQNYVAKVC